MSFMLAELGLTLEMDLTVYAQIFFSVAVRPLAAVSTGLAKNLGKWV